MPDPRLRRWETRRTCFSGSFRTCRFVSMSLQCCRSRLFCSSRSCFSPQGTFAGSRIAIEGDKRQPLRRNGLLYLSLALYLPFLVLADRHHAELAVALVVAIFALAHRNVLARVDWALILVFILMFIDLRLIAQHAAVRSLIEQVGLADSRRLYFAGIAASQVISNVPAAILLTEYYTDWRLIAYAVNVGGFGFVLGSLANIIALRMARDRKAWLTFHAFSMPFLLVAGGLVYLWLLVGG